MFILGSSYHSDHGFYDEFSDSLTSCGFASISLCLGKWGRVFHLVYGAESIQENVFFPLEEGSRLLSRQGGFVLLNNISGSSKGF